MVQDRAQHSVVDDRDIYAASAAGTAELREAGTALSSDALQVLVLMDGRTTVASIAGQLGLVREQAHRIVAELRGKRLIESTTPEVLTGVADHFAQPLAPFGEGAMPPPSATDVSAGMSSLRRAGYYVTIARRAGSIRKPGDKGGITVLVVDDDLDICDLIQGRLAREGFLPRVASTREETIDALRQLPVPDLALLDVMMPDADGFEVLTRIRRHEALMHMTVMMLTAVATRSAVLKGLQLGADGYVTKPFRPEVLMKAVRAVLGFAPAT